MEPILTRCGFRCDLCLAYRENVTRHPENQQKLSDGWFKYFGFRIAPEEIVCDGCLSDGGRQLDPGCPVRPCALARGVEHCAQCADYACDKLRQRLVVYEEMRARVGGEISDDDRRCFIEPYENKRRLDALRAG